MDIIFLFFRTFFQKVSQSVPLAPQAWPRAPNSYQKKAHGSENTAFGIPGGLPFATFFAPFSRKCAKVSHWLRRPGPELQKTTTKEPTGLKIRPPDHQTGAHGCPNAARGSQTYTPKNKTAHVRHPPPSVSFLARRLFCPKSGDLRDKT